MSYVLIIDDEPIIREPIAAALKSLGLETAVASTAREALPMLAKRRPDLILLDITMPDVDGLRFLGALRALPATQNIPVIMLTAADGKEQISAATRFGVSGYILKSQFSLRELMLKVGEHVLLTPVAADATSRQVSMNNSDKPAGAANSPSPSAPPGPLRNTTATASLGCAPTHARGEQAAVGVPISPQPRSTEPVSDPLEAIRSLEPLMGRTELKKVVEGCGELKGFSPAVANVLKLTANDHASIEQIARSISRDHAISLKVLKLANSAIYTHGEPVDSVSKAVLRVGLGQIRQIVLSIAVIDRFAEAGFEGFIESGHFWEHAIATGIIASEIAQARGDKEAEAMFTMGLLHDVGRMIFVTQLGEMYRAVLETARNLHLPLEQAEQRMLGYDHAGVIEGLLREWKFSKQFIKPVVLHHVDAGAIRTAAPQQVHQVATLALANRLAHALMLGSSGNETIYPIEELCELLKLTAESIARIEQLTRDETDRIRFALLAHSSQKNWAQRRDVHLRSLPDALRPLFVSSNPIFDSHRVFCEQLVDDRDGGRPNLGVLSIRSLREWKALAEQFVAEEKTHGELELPVLIIAPVSKVLSIPPALGTRRLEVLSTPFTISRFITAVASLMSATPVTADRATNCASVSS